MNRNLSFPMVFAASAAASCLMAPPLSATEADDKIETSFRETYVYRTYLKDDSVNTAAKDGVVTLTGTVSEEYHKSLAQETALGLPGVSRVDNQLATKAEVAADNADTWMGRKVTLTLLFHRNVNAHATTVVVTDGVVTLTGEATSDAQRELTTEYASDIDGVKSVKNLMTVVTKAPPAERTTGEKIDDASITAQVRTALQTHHSTSSLKTGVVTRNGAVSLTGIAKNAAEKTLVTKLVTDIQGVNSVNNEMTVAEVKPR